MHIQAPLNRRAWFKTTGAAVAGLALTSRLPGASGRPPEVPVTATGPVQLSLNENPLGPAPAAIEAMRAQVAFTHRYPFNRVPALVQAIAKQEDVPADYVVLGVGSGEILEAYGAYLGRECGEVITASPGYMQLAGAMERMGSRVVRVPVNDRLEHDLEAMAAAITADTKCIYVCNPNNPTGTIVNAERLRAFVIDVAKKVPVFIDEAYLECSDDFAANTMVSLVREGHNVTIARTFSKIYGLAGQRIGYGIMSPKQAKAVRILMTGSVNLLGTVGAQASLDDAAYVGVTRRKIKAGRDALLDVLRGLGRRYAEPQGNFVFFHTGMQTSEFQSKMRTAGVVVARPFPPLTDWCRISVGLPAEMTVAHAALRQVLG